MKPLINLIKKDFLLIKKYLIVMLVFSIIAPIIISARTPELQTNGLILYVLLTLMLTFMTYHMISMEEMKQKGMVYIQTTPMSNSLIALSKITVVTISFITITFVYIVLSKIELIKVGSVGLKEIMITFMLIEVFISIYIPLTFKLGYVKLQMVSAGIIFISPFLMGILSKSLNDNATIFLKMKDISNNLLFIISITIIFVLISASIKVTSLILDNKEY